MCNKTKVQYISLFKFWICVRVLELDNSSWHSVVTGEEKYLWDYLYEVSEDFVCLFVCLGIDEELQRS